MPESDFDVDKLRAIASGDDLAADVAAAVIRQRVEQ